MIEGRLNRGLFKELKEGDEIVWKANDDTCRVKIVKIVPYNTIREMLEKEGIERVLPGFSDIANGINLYRKYYSEQDEEKFNVIAIKMKKI